MSATESAAESAVRGRRGAEHPGPPVGAPAIGFAVFFLASALAGPLTGAGALPSPGSSPAMTRHYVLEHGRLLQVGSFLMLLAAVMLALFTAICWSRLDFLAPNAPGPAIAAAGGVSAAVLLALCAIFQWALSRPYVGDRADSARIVSDLVFVSGGPAHTTALGVLTLGVAVTCWFLRRLPVWLPPAGLVAGGVAVLSSLSLLSVALAPLIPAGRFAAMAWLIAVAVLIPRTRVARRR